ncbi:winged helix-turn-helix transcriptional regulator [Frondihabitans australicus]|uniref:HxlR family transcriptional regulator n=1 Tax=Frondihabitans australicus TaxID=386892 RepID=A0A495IK48_9MICO|nr:helix-turn-helix domain-containing protein [Frondihabitans australicus]RKR75798.1 HxlR family transcriptional regulator [Frondihabitans australicus]
MALGTNYKMDDCAVALTLDVVGERWTLLIVSYLFFGLRRYSDIIKRLKMSPAVLTQRLNGLIENDLVARVPGPGAHDEYELTAKGETLWPIVSGLVQWGNGTFLEPEQRHEFTHRACGTDLDAAGYCPTCRIVPAARQIDRQPRAVDCAPAADARPEAEPRPLLQAARTA